MMIIVYHRFLHEKIDPNIETLILGTFNPETSLNSANYFYSRPQNHFWRLLPLAVGEATDFRGKSKEQKQDFCRHHKIGFADLIAAVCVLEGMENNFSDAFIDRHVYQWFDIVSLINGLPNLKRIYFTRKTLNDIPSIGKQVKNVEIVCRSKGISFTFLPTPARVYNWQKQEHWNLAFNDCGV